MYPLRNYPGKGAYELTHEVNLSDETVHMTLKTFMLEGSKTLGPFFFVYSKDNNSEVFARDMLASAGIR